MMMDDMQATGGSAWETIKAIGADNGFDPAIAPVEAGDAATCEARLDAMEKVLVAWKDRRPGEGRDSEAIEWTVDYALDPILSLGSADRARLMGRYAGDLLGQWDASLLKILPLRTAYARLMNAALDGEQLSDSQAKMLRFKFVRSKEGLGKRA